MLADKAHIFVQAGGGGDGCMSFRREAHVPRGGPDGGDGGHGGDVVLVCDDSLRDLQAFKRRAHFKARRGGHGQGSLRHGADGEDLVIRVPPGTQVTLADGTMHDLVAPGQRAVVARGGAGGRGNKRFAGPTHQSPRFAERGLPGEEAEVTLRLKLLADVGLVGLPNAGKSSLLSRMTRAHPKVAGYPFTTLEPVLGTLDGEDRQVVVADIPGLIEGASDGAGLGHDFLAHVERTALLVHVLDLAPPAPPPGAEGAQGVVGSSDPRANHATIEAELAAHDPRLAGLPRILALSKADLVTAEEAARAAREWEARLGDHVAVLVTSAATGEGLDELAAQLLRRVPLREPVVGDVAGGRRFRRPAAKPLSPAPAEHRVFRPARRGGFAVEAAGEGAWRVSGEAVERLLARHDLDNEDALAHVEHRLGRMGVIRALEERGFAPGDDVEIAGVVFELDPG
ncbi:MAG: GTPase ObgE [Actinomycetota bacterium]|nr:GTPase ObgE [Actinomycetota bacterium]